MIEIISFIIFSFKSTITIICLLISIIFSPDPVADYSKDQIGVETDKKVLHARGYHGVLISVKEANGYEWFERDGKRCGLFTEGWKKSWERKEKEKDK